MCRKFIFGVWTDSDADETKQRTGIQFGKTENNIEHQIRKTAYIFAKTAKPGAKERKNCNPQRTPKTKIRRLSVQNPKNRPTKSPKKKIENPDASPNLIQGFFFILTIRTELPCGSLAPPHLACVAAGPPASSRPWLVSSRLSLSLLLISSRVLTKYVSVSDRRISYAPHDWFNS